VNKKYTYYNNTEYLRFTISFTLRVTLLLLIVEFVVNFQMREMKRIKEAGGFITFNGVWRVAGILATSRALGDYPLKDKRLVIAEPDILTFDLESHKPAFLVLASDGLWDTFSNEEAVAFLKEHITSPDLGAKSITMQSYCRGSLDNITVLIIRLKYP
jgi:protein phosphatase 1L